MPELLACAFAALVYLPALGFGFVYDDVPQILKNPAIQSWRYLPQYFTAHVWAAIYPGSTGNYYRPLFLLWLRLNYVLFGTDPLGWHAASILCHVAATWLVFRLAQQLTRNRWMAFWAAAVFGVHAAHIENVAWISGVTDPLMACFLLASCSAFVGFCESGRRRALSGSLGLFALGLMSKETAAVLPVLIFALAMLRPFSGQSEIGKARILAALRSTLPFALIDLVYSAVRYRALGGFAHPTIAISWKEVLLTWPAVLWFYARHLLCPVGLSEFYSLDYVRRATAASVLFPLLSLVAIGIFVYLLIRRLYPRQTASIALCLLVVPLLPVLNLRSLTAGDIVHDRYLYLPSAGFAILVAMAIAALVTRVSNQQGKVVALIVLTLAALTATQQAPWGDDIRLYARGLESAPDNLTVRDNLANALLGAGRFDRAIPLYLDVLKRNPDFWRSNNNLGYAYYKTGNYAAAEEYLRRAVRIDPGDADQFIYLALAQLQLKELAAAEANARSAIAKKSGERGYHFVLGLIEEAQGERDAAIADFKTELTLYPTSTSAAAELRKIQGN